MTQYETYLQNIEWKPTKCEDNNNGNHHFYHLQIEKKMKKKEVVWEIIVWFRDICDLLLFALFDTFLWFH